MEDHEGARLLARDALSEEDGSVEMLARSALEVATLLAHAWWCLWLELQLTDLAPPGLWVDGPPPMESVSLSNLGEALARHAAVFAGSGRHKAVLDSALQDYMQTRTVDDDLLHASGIASLERRALKPEGEVQRRILGRLSERIGDYLTACSR